VQWQDAWSSAQKGFNTVFQRLYFRFLLLDGCQEFFMFLSAYDYFVWWLLHPFTPYSGL
jgi:hypothetical protein